VPQVCHLSAGKGEVISLLDSPLRGRNTFRGRAFHNFDFAIIKDTNFGQRNKGERLTLQFRAEFFNVFNLVNLGLPANIVLGSGFGLINRTVGTSRQIQFSLKLIY
jgi:hypothetical protein